MCVITNGMNISSNHLTTGNKIAGRKSEYDPAFFVEKTRKEVVRVKDPSERILPYFGTHLK